MNPRFCQRCGVQIPAERIEALPDTIICVKCSQEIGGEFQISAVPESIGKSGSLKKNYGGWSIVKRRRRIVPKQE
jgi:hypothetical protein